jgi:hypothetical protein
MEDMEVDTPTSSGSQSSFWPLPALPGPTDILGPIGANGRDSEVGARPLMRLIRMALNMK